MIGLSEAAGFAALCQNICGFRPAVLMLRIFLILAVLAGFAAFYALQILPAMNDAVMLGEQHGTPVVPTTPEDIQRFAEEMDQFMQDSARRRMDEVDKQSR